MSETRELTEVKLSGHYDRNGGLYTVKRNGVLAEDVVEIVELRDMKVYPEPATFSVTLVTATETVGADDTSN